jgi:aminopeptidase
MKAILEKYADLLIGYSLYLEKGEKLLISSTYLAEPLIREVYRAALRAGAHPETMIGLDGTARILYDCGDEAQLGYISPMYAYAVEQYDAFLTIRAPFNVRELETADGEKKKTSAMAQTAVKKRFRERAAAGELKWTLCEYPTQAQAQESGLSLPEYEEIIFSACYLKDEDPSIHWKEIHDKQQGIVEGLNSCTRIRFVGPDTDLSFSTKGRTWVNSDGKHNMPSGEVFTSPVETSVDGIIRFTYPGIFMGQELEDILLHVREGEVVRWDAKKGRPLLDSIMEIPGARRFGEAAIGTNWGISRFTKNILFDEKMGGTIHMALGSSYPETGGENESSIHWDLLADMKDGGEIYADGELIYRNGKFLKTS